MYKLLLISKYLRKRRIAWASLAAVTLCTAMVIVVISVMGGWLAMFRSTFQGLSGDVIVQGVSLTGIPHYEEMIERLEATPEVDAAVPTITTFGLVNLNNQIRRGVEVVGYPLDQIGRVNAFPQSLYLQHELRQTAGRPDADLTYAERDYLSRVPPNERPSWVKPYPDEFYTSVSPAGRPVDYRDDPTMVVGIGVANLFKDEEGRLERGVGLYPFPVWAILTTLAIDDGSTVTDIEGSKAERRYVVIDDSRTGVWQNDTSTVYVPFDVLQRDLRMDYREERDLETGEVYVYPARTRDIQVKLAVGVPLERGMAVAEAIVASVRRERAIGGAFPIRVATWEQTQETFIRAVEKEKALVTFLFGVISLVAVFLIFCIFYMIVMEKTKDIGIVKSVGATGVGVAGVFLGYGLAIGLLGAGLGLTVGGLIVTYINEIHDLMQRWLGVAIYSAEVYAFDTLPNTMDPREVAVILAVAVLSSVAGALVPAIRAARMQPVEALRFE